MISRCVHKRQTEFILFDILSTLNPIRHGTQGRWSQREEKLSKGKQHLLQMLTVLPIPSNKNDRHLSYVVPNGQASLLWQEYNRSKMCCAKKDKMWPTAQKTPIKLAVARRFWIVKFKAKICMQRNYSASISRNISRNMSTV